MHYYNNYKCINKKKVNSTINCLPVTIMSLLFDFLLSNCYHR